MKLKVRTVSGKKPLGCDESKPNGGYFYININFMSELIDFSRLNDYTLHIDAGKNDSEVVVTVMDEHFDYME